MDLEGFFPNITFPRVRSVFQRLGYSPAAATILALLCTECPRRPVEYAGKVYHVATGPRGLPQGACTSPGLSNQVARKLDKRLGGLARKLGLTYTRYADDLTFSGDGELKQRVGYLMARIRHIAQEEGFAVNEKKSRVLRRSAAQVVTGLVVNDRPGVSRREVRRLRAILHRARTEGLEQQNRENRPNFRAWLLGKIAYVSMARPEIGARLRREFDGLIAKE
jgi:retron-type reverse transcriptase